MEPSPRPSSLNTLGDATVMSSDQNLDMIREEPSLISGILSALDSNIRIQILLLLHKRDHYVFELVQALGGSQPLISQHLRVLKQARIIDNERQGRQIIYRLKEPMIVDIIAKVSVLSQKVSKVVA
ncbi:ArsR family transcriptional regulator [Corynebacterium diphtheriae]|uniref:ArsR/SmtB family transcription factor n=1 Tax=Corynebacterium diphtheriae TaxID=1717 RepID=UPI0008FB4F18|nr:metalloregulator ArsR/SmtB family transcription factor [Corynebacterium diphtheriae]MBG9316266.1 winged helix-turn-helix transcriptional regulator [Corynebacterium diphtheriae bv. mitis]OIR70463.1 transcriptional regulator [Corynebacterium diphtheriae]OIR74865.1 transcriptional regulator [Corynebacterium diphtheriae]OIR80579.1 transcriptional regulator [Corynebacterium diphtheriae]OIR99767.1 transcriptional regulator [Corynebacterium diphtheriae]